MEPISQLTSYLFTQGVLGVVVIALGIVCVILYRSNQKLQTKIIDLTDAWRRSDIDRNDRVTSALQDYSQTMQILSAKIDAGKRGK